LGVTLNPNNKINFVGTMSPDKINNHSTVLDLESLRKRFDGEWDLLYDLRDLFLGQYSEILDEISGDIESQNGRALERSAHSLKNMLGNFSALRACELVDRMEKNGAEMNFTQAANLVTPLREEIEQALVLLENFLVECNDGRQ
jgi:HPt (histidine-containing phosphotransfer) domain-containing protein